MSRAGHNNLHQICYTPPFSGSLKPTAQNEDGLFGGPIKPWMPEGYVWKKGPPIEASSWLDYFVLSDNMRYVT
jgi:hypothetical protein